MPTAYVDYLLPFSLNEDGRAFAGFWFRIETAVGYLGGYQNAADYIGGLRATTRADIGLRVSYFAFGGSIAYDHIPWSHSVQPWYAAATPVPDVNSVAGGLSLSLGNVGRYVTASGSESEFQWRFGVAWYPLGASTSGDVRNIVAGNVRIGIGEFIGIDLLLRYTQENGSVRDGIEASLALVMPWTLWFRGLQTPEGQRALQSTSTAISTAVR
ncbi:MAG TPA: hypothetical protein DCQ04_08405 [Actinobacteria bacterium]|nr:hypothetical protein [Actinomycetota bacterium]